MCCRDLRALCTIMAEEVTINNDVSAAIITLLCHLPEKFQGPWWTVEEYCHMFRRGGLKNDGNIAMVRTAIQTDKSCTFSTNKFHWRCHLAWFWSAFLFHLPKTTMEATTKRGTVSLTSLNPFKRSSCGLRRSQLPLSILLVVQVCPRESCMTLRPCLSLPWTFATC